jgi:nucleotide-binding universal stress UspA family protein
MFEKIVVAIDGSPYSDAAIAAAGELSKKLKADLEVLHIHEHDAIPSKAGMSPDLETPDDAKTIVAVALERLEANGVTARGHVLQASTRDVPRRIIEFTNENGADLIIVGRRGLSSLTGMLVGSVSNKLIHAATVPVLVAH